MSLPRDAVGWSAVCDCGISWHILLLTCIKQELLVLSDSKLLYISKLVIIILVTFKSATVIGPNMTDVVKYLVSSFMTVQAKTEG